MNGKIASSLMTSSLFPKRLRDLRTRANWSQQDLADKSGLERKSIIRYENGQGVPNSKALQSLANLFGVSTDYLLGLNADLISESDLTAIEREAIQAFRRADSDDQRQRLLEALQAFLQAEK